MRADPVHRYQFRVTIQRLRNDEETVVVLFVYWRLTLPDL